MAKKRKKRGAHTFPKKKEGISRRKFLTILGLAGAAVVSYSAIRWISEDSLDKARRDPEYHQDTILASEDSLDRARRDSEKRQEYLLDLVDINEIPYCSGIVYDHNGTKIIEHIKLELEDYEGPAYSLDEVIAPHEKQFKDGDFMARVPDIFDLSGRGRHTKIFMGRVLFEDQETTPPDLKHTIVAHEGRHVLQYAKGLEFMEKEILLKGFRVGLIHRPVLYEVGELDANYHGLKRIDSGEFKVTEGYHQFVIRKYNTNKNKLKSILNRSSDIQKRLINNALEACK